MDHLCYCSQPVFHEVFFVSKGHTVIGREKSPVCVDDFASDDKIITKQGFVDIFLRILFRNFFNQKSLRCFLAA